jgi:hypothetical protein
MRRLAPWCAVVLLLGGCSYAWIRPDATPEQARADEERCREEAAASVQAAWSDVAFGWGPMYRPWGPAWYGGGPGWYGGGPGWYGGWPDPSVQLAAEQRLHDRCMRTKGYDLVRTDRKTGEPR